MVQTETAADPVRYDAVRRRDRAMDGHFVYAVRTTGVYCRPSCAARLARPENVSFHPTCQAAEQAGFRPCRRCHPNAEGPAERDARAVQRAVLLIEAAEEGTPSLADLAEAGGLSPSHFHRLFRRVTGVTPRAYAAALRASRVGQALAGGDSVTAALYGAGYTAPSRFYQEAPARLGMAPAAYRRGGAGATIRFAVGQCSLGAILVAATATGICAILLGEEPEALLQDLQDRFPRAELLGGDAAFEQVVAQAVGLVETPGLATTLPLDIAGTAFQQRVWQALRAIPAGHTATYAEVAAAIGSPAAVRAVARACAANPLAVAIPCHRVVRADGGLAGYRWGIERKRTLLAREAA